MGFNRALKLVANPPPPPPPPHPLPLPAFLSSFFCYATSKTFEWHFAMMMVARHCVLAGIGYVHYLYRHLVALH